MNASRRLSAVALALCVLWAALWPLVSAAYFVGKAESMPICGQAGLQVSPAMAPMQRPGEPYSPGKQHCPLCVMAFFGGLATPVTEPGPPRAAGVVPLMAYWAPLPARVETRLPPSRAPPSLSRG